MLTGHDKHEPQIGEYLEPDGRFGSLLYEDDGFSDSEFPGCQFRFSNSLKWMLAINLKVTGKPHFNSYPGRRYKSRVRIEWVQDGGEPSTFSGGWLYHD